MMMMASLRRREPRGPGMTGLCKGPEGRRLLSWTLLFSSFPIVVASILLINPRFAHRQPRQQRRSSPQHSATRATSLSATLTVIASAGISPKELGPIQKAIVMACQDQEVHGSSLDHMIALEEPINTIILGATGRVMLLKATRDLPDDEMFDLQCEISQEMDELIYANPPILSQPVLLSIQKDLPENLAREEIVAMLAERIEHEVQQYEMNIALPSNPGMQGNSYVPSLRVELDGAQVTSAGGNTLWDTSSLLVFDNLVNDDLRKRLLNVVLGNNNGDFEWDDAKNGPDPRRWARGGLLDIPAADQKEEDGLNGLCWGLREEAITELCFEHHDALEEFEIMLSDLFPQFTINRLPEAVLGSGVSPLTANAATFGDRFDWHIDADPNLTPPSPWTDIFGRYPNRCRGKPRFMSCLIYLRDWHPDEWGASTRFLDVATDTHYNIEAIPGRVVIMDQDITHSVVAPLQAAGRCPRYSLVWKLILHPRRCGQDMTDLALSRDWPEPTLLGSAAKENIADDTG